MPVVFSEAAISQEVSDRIDLLRTRYADNPLVEQIEYRIATDWTDDPAVYIKIILPDKDIEIADVVRLAKDIRGDLFRLVRTEEIGLHSYLNFAKQAA